MSLHGRIFLLVLLMLLGLGSTSTAFLYRSTAQRVEAEVADRLEIARRSFIDGFENRQMNLTASVRTVVNDWGLRQAIGQHDRSTLESVLANHSNRIGADVAFFIDLEETVFASTTSGVIPPEEIAKLISESGGPYRFLVSEQRILQLVVSEVRAPVRLGWVAMGFAIDDTLASHFSRLHDVEVSFVSRSRSGPVASSLPEGSRIQAAVIAERDNGGLNRVGEATWEDLALNHVLGDSDLVVVLQKSLSEPMASFRSWWWSLLTIFSLIVMLALGVAWAFSRGITQPLTQLLFAVQNMEAGNYSTLIDVDRNDEIGFLSKAFAKMQRAIGEREEEIRYRADHDLVTRIHNRNGFLDGLEHRIGGGESGIEALIVLCLSVNHFKEIVDALGHTWGDRLLRMVADRLQQKFARNAVAHVDSDQFAMIGSSGDAADFFELADAVHRCFEDDFEIRGISLSLSVCIGISVYPEHAGDAQSLLRRAGVALNEAHESHKRTVVYDPDLDQNSVKRLTLMSELPNAIRAGQLDLHYQPQVRCVGEEAIVDGVECLVRWHHPGLGSVPPDEFIGLAEKTGYIVELTRYVLRLALARCREWRDRQWGLGVSVNISALDLQRSAFARDVREMLETYRLPPEVLCLEVTESAAMEDPQSSIRRLSALKELGVRLSIDDYGTGYSSLAHLRQLPVHELKIDKSFVLELDRSEDDQTIVRSTIELAHNVGLEVVAEGVESQRILWQLDQWGCDRAQGFHVSRPLAFEAFTRWLEDPPYRVARLEPRDATRNPSAAGIARQL
jgi:diguanylate cyclase (GGDEF)-like protein